MKDFKPQVENKQNKQKFPRQQNNQQKNKQGQDKQKNKLDYRIKAFKTLLDCVRTEKQFLTQKIIRRLRENNKKIKNDRKKVVASDSDSDENENDEDIKNLTPEEQKLRKLEKKSKNRQKNLEKKLNELKNMTPQAQKLVALYLQTQEINIEITKVDEYLKEHVQEDYQEELNKIQEEVKKSPEESFLSYFVQQMKETSKFKNASESLDKTKSYIKKQLDKSKVKREHKKEKFKLKQQNKQKVEGEETAEKADQQEQKPEASEKTAENTENQIESEKPQKQNKQPQIKNEEQEILGKKLGLLSEKLTKKIKKEEMKMKGQTSKKLKNPKQADRLQKWKEKHNMTENPNDTSKPSQRTEFKKKGKDLKMQLKNQAKDSKKNHFSQQNNNNKTDPAANKLHPSWAAKKELKQKENNIYVFQGEKKKL
ncbi:hypothetical protein PPERSA_10171 [Pseudocohnilembus persalinus]|uniref:Bud22 domain-containing protein n=1 Tax=Pseudocohnilembus persalinus TaxID=266149 RepID=A0A0V0QLH3_PSEPJ|nr:hypothetical protein PPERSA_10171 [Pseudocohnilembus persalinus]|eukprot:KRX03090.1 hypothetical protein PPERSA_10171 [Pseudocohnilembus persalinus]